MNVRTVRRLNFERYRSFAQMFILSVTMLSFFSSERGTKLACQSLRLSATTTTKAVRATQNSTEVQ